MNVIQHHPVTVTRIQQCEQCGREYRRDPITISTVFFDEHCQSEPDSFYILKTAEGEQKIWHTANPVDHCVCHFHS